jgi:mannosylglycerate hydrolase
MRTLHLVSHTHWDREWYLTFQQFRLKLVHLIDGLLDLLSEDPGYKYFMLDGQTIVLDDYLQMRPEREQELRTYIQKGRILVGPWHVLPDEFLVSPEATIRNLLEGERTAHRFGPKMMIGYIPDTFGHIGQMPQILRGFGIEYAAVYRGLADEPCEIWWEALDGSRVFTAYLRDSYDNAAGLPASDPKRFAEEVIRLRDHLAPNAQAEDILLMYGTDHMEPSPDTSAAIASVKGKFDGDMLVHSTLTQYLERAVASVDITRLPVVRGELRSSKRHHLLPNVLSTRMWIKQRNRAAEILLEKWAEPFSTWQELVTPDDVHSIYLRQKSELVQAAWRLLMENHPHDSICGSGIDQVHEEMRTRFDQVEQVSEEIIQQSLAAIADAVSTQSTSTDLSSAIVVFNPTGAVRTDLVIVDLGSPEDVELFEIVDEAGKLIPYQVTGTGHRELINLSMDKNAFRDAFSTIHEGRVAGMAIQRIRWTRHEDTVFIEATLDEGGEPDLDAWEKGVREAEELITDLDIKTVQIRAITAQSTSILFSAPEVPGHGWRTFWVRALQPPPVPDPSQSASINPITRPLMPIALRLAQTPLGQNLMSRLAPGDELKPPFRIENEYLIVEANEDGTLTIRDRLNVAIYRGLNRFVDGGDCGDEYNYAPPASDTLVTAQVKSIKIYRRPARPTLELSYELEAPLELTVDRSARQSVTTTISIVSRISLSPGIPRVDVATEVDNHARDHRLRVHFTTPFAANAADHDGHFEVVHRPIGVPDYDNSWIEAPRPEVPQRAFTDISDGQLGLMIANKGLPEVEVLKRPNGKAEIALTLLRCVGWLSRDDFSTRHGHAGPSRATPEAQMQGVWTFEYAIIPHGGDWRTAFERAYAYEAPLRAVSTDAHEGTLPVSGAFIQATPETFVISAVKAADEGNAWLVRGYNIDDTEIQVTIKPWRPFKSARLVNLAEKKRSALKSAADGTVSFAARGHEIISVMFND